MYNRVNFTEKGLNSMSVDKKERLEKKIEIELQKLSQMTRMLKGNLNEIKVTCGNKNCKCNKGYKHQAFSITYKGDKNITKSIYVRKNKIKQAKQLIKNYQKAKSLFDTIVDLNIDLFKLDK